MNAEQLSTAAHKAVTEFINARNCQTRDEVLQALQALGEMAAQARLTVKYGKMEKLS